MKKLQQEIPTIDLVGYEPTKEEILRKKSLEEMKRLEKAEIARITEKRKRDVVEMRMKGMRRVGSKAAAKRLITGGKPEIGDNEMILLGCDLIGLGRYPSCICYILLCHIEDYFGSRSSRGWR